MLADFPDRWELTVHGLVTLAGLAIYAIASHTRRHQPQAPSALAEFSEGLVRWLAFQL